MEPASSLSLSKSKAFAPQMGLEVELLLLFSSCSFCLTTLLAFLFSAKRGTKHLTAQVLHCAFKALHFLTHLVCSSSLVLCISSTPVTFSALPSALGLAKSLTAWQPHQSSWIVVPFASGAVPFGDWSEFKDPEIVLLVDRSVHLLTAEAAHDEPSFPHSVPANFSVFTQNPTRFLNDVSQVPGVSPDSQ